MKKKVLLSVVTMLLLFAGVVGAASINGDFQGNPIVKVKSNGKVLPVEDSPAVIQNGRTMVPIYMLRNLGLEVEWIPEEYAVDVKTKNTSDFSTTLEKFSKLASEYGGRNVSFHINEEGNSINVSITATLFGSDNTHIANLSKIIAGTIFTEINIYKYSNSENGEILGLYTIGTKDVEKYHNGDIILDQFVSTWEVIDFTELTSPTSTSTDISPLSAKEIAKLMDRVGYVTVYSKYDSLQPIGQGSGFFISSNGLFITNSHVASGTGGMKIEINNKEYNTFGEFLFDNPTVDIFGVYIGEKNEDGSFKNNEVMPYLEMSTTLPEIGDKVYAIGSPNGLDNTLSEGIVSGIRTWNNVTLIQHTADTESGSSGGALLNEYGQVIGITSSGIPNTTQDFAIPMSYVMDEINKLIN